ncbi:SDR family oxidoreductase [Ferrimonas gelatinilytica]|uniref:SDR family oxidoreductase n=1 Tax=Ferrimonas gelatinilytica TaxID=1255257 RepID=A0ABP9RSK0_9GAMM
MTQTVLITGANRGIGLEFTRQSLDAGDQVIACCRAPEQAQALEALAERFPQQLELVGLDLGQPQQLTALQRYLGERRVDLLISNAGVYGPKGLALGEYSAEPFADIMQVNVLAPLLLVQALRDNLAPGAKIALLSSKMGSVTDNTSGGAYFYRASKAALNAIGKSLAIDLADAGHPVVMLHPGWVQTDMGGPNALIDTEQSVSGMRQVIDGLTEASSGGFFSFDSSPIAW